MITWPSASLIDRHGEKGFWPSVDELLAAHGLALVTVAADKGLERPIRIVLTTELIDTSPFLRGGEVLLTTGQGWRSPEDAARFVRSAARAGVVAIGFGTGPWRSTVPEALITGARRAAVPLFEVPKSTPFMTIAERVADEQVARRATHTEQVTMGALMDHVRRGQADPAVLDDHAPFLYPRAAGAGGASGSATRQPLAVACHADDDGRSAPAPEKALVGRRGGRVIVMGEEAAVRWYIETRAVSVYGWGGPAGIRDLRRILGEAWSAFEVALPRGRPATARDLASMGGLLARLSPEQLAPFVDHALEPIRRYDALHGSDLQTTVQTFVRVHGSVAETGRDLFLHVNTVRQRMTRVGALLGLDPMDPEGYMVLWLAVHAASRT